LMTLGGDQGVNIDFGGTRMTVQDAGKLADAARKRLEKPLDLSGNSGVSAAADCDATHRPKRRERQLAVLSKAMSRLKRFVATACITKIQWSTPTCLIHIRSAV